LDCIQFPAGGLARLHSAHSGRGRVMG
jgi:hypothetical protein